MLPKYKCTRCGHKWIPRIERLPKRCPGCTNPYWNKPRKTKLTKSELRRMLNK